MTEWTATNSVYEPVLTGTSEKQHLKINNPQSTNIAMPPNVGRVAPRKKSSTNSAAWLWFWDVKETQNSQKWKKILSHLGGLVVHRQKILPYFGWIGYVCQVLSPRWLKILFHFWQFWVPFISQNHNQAVELVELFFPLSYTSNIGCTVLIIYKLAKYTLCIWFW